MKVTRRGLFGMLLGGVVAAVRGGSGPMIPVVYEPDWSRYEVGGRVVSAKELTESIRGAHFESVVWDDLMTDKSNRLTNDDS